MVQQALDSPRLWHELSDARIPEDLSQSLLTLDQYLQASAVERKIAVFDLDNTLLLGDIGDAVFASLKLRGHLRDLTWDSYRKLLASDRATAYGAVVKAMAGLTEHQIQKVTLDTLSQDNEYLELEHSYIPIPRANPVMSRIVDHLRATCYQVCVISASNEISARLAAWKLLGIPPFCVFGIRQVVRDRKLTDELITPIPVGAGKVEVYRQYRGEVDPFITAGDSMLDVPMMNLVDPVGFSIWVGEDKNGFDIARRKLGRAHTVHFLQRLDPSQFDEESSDG